MPKVIINVNIDEKRKLFKLVEKNGNVSRLATLYDKEEVKGKVKLNLGSPKIFEHKGIKLELIVAIENTKDKKDSFKFLSLTNELQNIGVLTNESIIDFYLI